MPKVIFVGGLGHSGSTVLAMKLATGAKAVALGELARVLASTPRKVVKRGCSCGALAESCRFWGPVVNKIADQGEKISALERHRLILQRVQDVYGDGMAIIDSSKKIDALQFVVQCDEISLRDVAVIHNIKDVRAFTVSTIDKKESRGARPQAPERIFYAWWKQNRTFAKAAGEMLLADPITISYDQLCLSTERVVSRLEKRLGAPYATPDGRIDSDYAHVIAGNRARLHAAADGIKRLKYDSRWFARNEWVRPYFLLPMVRRYNEQLLRDH